jgi:putative component of toxin-antitoxin plasmid stabilization module
MWQVDYYTRPNGHKPAKEWIEAQDNSIRPSIDARIEKLKMEGLLLLDNGMLEPIRERPGGRIVPNFYELRHIGKKWRIATYHNRKRDIFVLISGWRKSRQIQEPDVQRALTLLNEYLSIEGG